MKSPEKPTPVTCKRGPRPDDDDTMATPLRTGPGRVRHGSPGPRHVQTRGVEEGRGPEGLETCKKEERMETKKKDEGGSNSRRDSTASFSRAG